MMAAFSILAGVGNGVFHPVDYTLLNRKVSAPRLGHAYSVHGITGSLGWALAPAMLVPLALAFSWRVALCGPVCWPSWCWPCFGSTGPPWRCLRRPRQRPTVPLPARAA
jgi:MFS family permease